MVLPKDVMALLYGNEDLKGIDREKDENDCVASLRWG